MGEENIISKPGKNISMEIEIPSECLDDAEGGKSINGRILIENPTLFWPDSVIAGNGEISSYAFERLSDSVFNFTITFNDNLPVNFPVKFWGEVLAGNALETEILIQFITDCPSFQLHTFKLEIDDERGLMPYIRKAYFSDPYPCPAKPGQEVRMKFNIDYESPVFYGVYDNIGQRLYRDEADFTPGYNSILINTPSDISPGMYIIAVETKFDTVQKKFIIVK